MINTIVVGVDGSQIGEKALALAGEIASKHQAKVVLVHVLLRSAGIDELAAIAQRLGFFDAVKAGLDQSVIPPIAAAEAGAVVPAPVFIVSDETLRAFGEKILAASKTVVPSGAAMVLADADPAGALLKAAEDNRADLIVLGSRGLGRIEGLLLGSVSQKVLQQAACACLVVK